MIGAIAIGLAAGVIAGLLGVGGGVLFVPGLVIFIGLTQHQAEATSLLAIVPVALAGAVLQDRYGNVRRGDALLIGALSVAGAAGGWHWQTRFRGRCCRWASRCSCCSSRRSSCAGMWDAKAWRSKKGSRLDVTWDSTTQSTSRSWW